MKECAIPRPSDRALMEGASTGVREIRRLGQEDVLASLRKIEKEIHELLNILEAMFEEGGG